MARALFNLPAALRKYLLAAQPATTSFGGAHLQKREFLKSRIIAKNYWEIRECNFWLNV